MSHIFDPDNFFFRWVSRVFDVMCLSLVWLALSLPVITIGASTTALYDAVVKCVRGREPHPYARYWDTFKKHLKIGCLATIPAIAIGVLLFLWYVLIGALAVDGDRSGTTAFIVYQFICLVPIGVVGFVFPTLSRFTFTVRELWVTCVKLALGHMLSTLVIGAVIVLSIQVALQLIFPAFFLPGIAALIASVFLERIYKPFLPKEEEEAPLEDEAGPEE